MFTRFAAALFGLGFLAIGIMGFLPWTTHIHQHDDPNLIVEGPGHGYLLGTFHVNVLHNVVHAVFGAMGLVCVGNYAMARGYFRLVTLVYALLAILGFFPSAKYLFGFCPLEGADIWLHAGIAVVACYFGFIRNPDRGDMGLKEVEVTPTETRERPLNADRPLR